ncbi:MAG TPA: GspH/FimT family pseudopilin [Longimicrobium sp.]|jgi:prepilin-type N-terminal cleavage/methylation domain-containing protein
MHTLPHPPLRCRRGYSLPELLATLVIVAIMAALAAPRLRGVGKSARQTGAMNQLATDLSLTRMRAIRAGNAARLVINSTGTAYQVEVRKADGVTMDTVKTVRVTQNYPGLLLRPVLDSVVFDSRGMRRGGTERIQALRDSAKVDSIKISPLGKVTRAR